MNTPRSVATSSCPSRTSVKFAGMSGRLPEMSVKVSPASVDLKTLPLAQVGLLSPSDAGLQPAAAVAAERHVDRARVGGVDLDGGDVALGQALRLRDVPAVPGAGLADLAGRETLVAMPFANGRVFSASQ